MAEKPKEEPKVKRFNILDTWDGEYHGNVFGNKVALWGGLFLLAVLLLMIYRHVSLGIPFGGETPPPPPVEEVQSPPVQ
ncbi:MAG: hypothetical protein AAFW73_10770 [Bacteroidota bacterium]